MADSRSIDGLIDGVVDSTGVSVAPGSCDELPPDGEQAATAASKAAIMAMPLRGPAAGVVLAGIMGMNFDLDFFDTAGNFFVVLGAMVVLAGLILGIARWRRWL